ncbi:hypothetical protein [Methylobacterium sp. CM6257]
MKKLTPGDHYRLRMLMGRPRLYRLNAVMKRLERLGLVAATGQSASNGEYAEYAITERGRSAVREAQADAPET